MLLFPSLFIIFLTAYLHKTRASTIQYKELEVCSSHSFLMWAFRQWGRSMFYTHSESHPSTDPSSNPPTHQPTIPENTGNRRVIKVRLGPVLAPRECSAPTEGSDTSFSLIFCLREPTWWPHLTANVGRGAIMFPSVLLCEANEHWCYG